MPPSPAPFPKILSEASDELMLKILRLELLNRDAKAALSRLREEGDPLADELEKTLRISEGLANEVRDMASGATLRRARPMQEAVDRALASGKEEDWREAMGLLAQRALSAQSPLYFAGALLDSLDSRGSVIPPRAFESLVEPLRSERSLGAPGYEWSWGAEADQLRARRCWERAEALCPPRASSTRAPAPFPPFPF